MLTLDFRDFPVLTSQRFVLRRITEEDAAEIFFLRSDKEILRYLDREPAIAREEAVRWIRMIDEGINHNEHIAWAISLVGSSVLIGTISLWNIKKEHYRGEIGYSLHTSYQGQGLMREAVELVLKYAFYDLGLHSVEANINPDNKASEKLLARCGFIREAYHRENYYFNGKFMDSAIYSLITPLTDK